MLNINARLRFWDSDIQWVALLTKKVGAVEIRRGDSMIKQQTYLLLAVFIIMFPNITIKL
ncbi:MAG: hypothetical protein E6778_21480 [Niallia nealsonii]|nr:hypothetical protein [Niallia nealsonii]